MSEKKLKQLRLPFQILSGESPKSSSEKSEEKVSPKPLTGSRKRKPSNEGDNLRSCKIGRVLAKENIAEDPIVISDNDDDQKNASIISKKEAETTPTTTTTTESVIHIKLPSSGKSKRKINMDLKQPKSLENNDDDSVVYIDEDEIQKSLKKSKKSDKKKKGQSSKKSMDSVRKSLKLNDSVEENKSSVQDVEQMDVDPVVTDDVFRPPEKKTENNSEATCKDTEKKNIPAISDTILKLVDESNKAVSISDDNYQEEILGVLSDDSGKSPNRKSSKSDDSFSKPSLTPTHKLTPKALARRKEQEAKRIEKELQRQKERDEREAQRLKEKEIKEEAKRKEKGEKELQRQKEREEREKKRLADLEKKEEEKRQKEEEKKRIAEQKEEEKRQKEEERRQKEEERKRQNEARDEEKRKKELEKLKDDERKKRAAEAFTKFFVPKKKSDLSGVQDDENSKESAESTDTNGKLNFMPFQIRGKMRLAPCVRLRLTTEQLDKLDKHLHSELNCDKLYLKELKSESYISKKCPKTWPDEDKDDDVVCIDELEGVGEDIKEDDAAILKIKHRAKFLMFSENRRPAFHGTWRKKTIAISARRPFAQDKKFFDYEIDSDEEWEEEEPGESLHGSDSEKEKANGEDDYDIDNDFFVPHGHLSDEELQQNEDGEMDDNSPEAQKAKLKIMQQEFAAEMKKKTEKIKPRLIGCIWMNGDEDENGASMIGSLEKKYHCSDIIWRILKAREMMCSGEKIKMEEFEPEIAEPEEEIVEKPVPTQKTPSQKKIFHKIDDAGVKELIRLIHGNVNSKKFLIKEFQAYRLKNYHQLPDFKEFLTKSIEEKIFEIGEYKTCPLEGPLFNKKCWLVKNEVIQQHYGEEKLPLPNAWIYLLENEKKKSKANVNVEKKASREVSPVVENIVVAGKSPFVKEPSKSPFVKETAKQINTKAQNSSSPVSTNSMKKKRVNLLMSVPRGQAINEDKKNNLISQYLKNNQNELNEKTEVKQTEDDDVEIID